MAPDKSHSQEALSLLAFVECNKCHKTIVVDGFDIVDGECNCKLEEMPCEK
jgi:hypothetical protein